MAFKMTVNTTALAEDPIERLIWAYSMTRPDSDSKNAHLQVHYRGGSLRVNFSKEAIPPPPPGASIDMSGHHHGTEDTTIFEGDNGAGVFTDDGVPWGNHEKLIAAHAVLLASGFLILLPGGTLIARWTRTITPKWFKAHSIINMTVSLPIIVIGWLLGPVAVLSHDAPHLNTTHQVSCFNSCSSGQLSSFSVFGRGITSSELTDAHRLFLFCYRSVERSCLYYTSHKYGWVAISIAGERQVLSRATNPTHRQISSMFV
jgi:hypothetical protein